MALPLQDTGILLGGAPLARMSQGSTKPESGTEKGADDETVTEPAIVPYVDPETPGTIPGTTPGTTPGTNKEPAIVPYVDPAETVTDKVIVDEPVTGPAPTPAPKPGTTTGRTTNRTVRTRLRRKPGKPPPIKGKRGLPKLGRATDGIFPKVVAWRSGFGYTTHNLRTGKTTFDDERPDGALEVSGPGAARKSFSVLEKGTTPPTQRQLDKGIMEVHIGPDGPRHRLKRGRGRGRRRR